MLPAGTTLGPYEIVALLGAGGMGEVYRAHDRKLGRDVALKILPAAFALESERMSRFRREAQLLASLNHPHIAGIYGSEEAGGAHFLVLELVDGETLAERLRRSGPLPVAEALGIARQIADALEAAHEKGIVHRDLKPANIALTGDDKVKVLDFGLARAMDATGAPEVMNSPTLTFQATQAGVILGTAAYMSPEQAKGRAADKRSDIWAFGCVLYEMLTGTRAHAGDDVSDTLASVLRGEPDWSALPQTVPEPIRTLVRRCLVKDRHERIADVAVVRYVLSETASAPVARHEVAVAPSRRRAVLGLGGAVVLLALVAAAWSWLTSSAPPPSAQTVRFTIPLPGLATATGAGRHLIALSQDGKRFAFVGTAQIHLRTIDQLETSVIRGTVENPSEPVFSPDGEWLAYYAASHIRKVPVSGGAPISICQTPSPLGATWFGDRIIFGDQVRGILEVPASGGVPQVIIAADSKIGELLHGPQMLPGGDAVLFTSATPAAIVDRWASADIAVQSLKTGERKILVRGATDGRFVPTGHLIYARGGVLYANAFDVKRLELRGGPTSVVEGVAQPASSASGAYHYAISQTGTLAYLQASTIAATTLAWRKRGGGDTPIPAPPHVYQSPRISPDGTRIAVQALDQDNDIWTWDTRSETLTRLTFERTPDSFPLWTRDGKRIVYVAAPLQQSLPGGPQLMSKPADGTGQPEPMFSKPIDTGGALVPNAATTDGRHLVFSVGVPSNVMLLSLDRERTVRPLMTQPAFAERGADVSPDGRWIAYQSDESGTFQVYVRPFPNVDDGRWQISSDGGALARWSPDGRELFFVAGGKLFAVRIQPGPVFAFGKPTAVIDLADTPSAVYRNYDVAPDGTRFVVVRQERSQGAGEIITVVNWFSELASRVPAR